MSDKKTIKWISEKSKTQRWKMVFLIISNIVFSLLSVLFAFGIKMVVDGAVNKKSDTLIFGAVGLGVIVILQFVFRLLINGLTENIKARLDIIYKTHIFSNILNKNYLQWKILITLAKTKK